MRRLHPGTAVVRPDADYACAGEEFGFDRVAGVVPALGFAALEAVVCFADLDESELRNLGPDPYLDRCFAAETALLDALWWQALLSGPVTGCSARMARYRKVRDALLRRSYQLLTMQRREGAQAFALMALSVVHHEVSGAALTAECSTGHDWT